MKNNNLEKFAGKFVEIMSEKIRTIEKDWKTPWFTSSGRDLSPRNITGRKYRGGNIFMLLFYLMQSGHLTPYFLTFKQAKQRGLSVNKGANAFPVFYYIFGFLNKETREKISREEYDSLSEQEKKGYFPVSRVKYYHVFNIGDTDFEEVYPGKWKELLEKHSTKMQQPDESGMFSCIPVDHMLAAGDWICEILLRSSNRAYYSPTDDHIVCPHKNRFHEGESFYATLLHEMAHSTKLPERLNRAQHKRFGDETYAREELVAELTSALCCFYLGFGSTIRDENAAYLKSWLGALKESPEYLLNVLGDSTKAVRMIIGKLGMERVFEDEQPLLVCDGQEEMAA